MSNSNTSETTETSTVTSAPPETSVDDPSSSVETESTATTPPDTAEPPEDESLSLDIVFGILSNRRRQLVLEYLRDNEGEATTGELAEHIAAIENDTTVQQLNAQQRKRVYIGLYQSHLPKMDDVGVIDFNQSRGRVSPGKHVAPLYEYLDIANDSTGTDEEAAATEEADNPGRFSAIASGDADGESLLSDRHYAAGYLLFALAFFAAQLTGAYVVASGTVVLFLVVVVAVSYQSI